MSAVYQDETYYDLSGSAGTVLCFHGAGGSARSWAGGDAEKHGFVTDLVAAGYSVICPTAKARNGKWATPVKEKNKDIEAVDELIREFVARGPFYVVGHSNGGGFAARYALFGCREIAAVQYSNSPGVTQILEDRRYYSPTLFCYSQADPVVDYLKVAESIAALELREIQVEDLDLTEEYAAQDARFEHDHKFFNTSAETIAFFQAHG